jgi:hypothetical protein
VYQTDCLGRGMKFDSSGLYVWFLLFLNVVFESRFLTFVTGRGDMILKYLCPRTRKMCLKYWDWSGSIPPCAMQIVELYAYHC